jgi:hypothetical protein
MFLNIFLILIKLSLDFLEARLYVFDEIEFMRIMPRFTRDPWKVKQCRIWSRMG